MKGSNVMSEKTIMIEIDEQGNSSLDLQGFQGKGCSEVAKALQGADNVTKSRKKREFHVEAAAQHPAVQRRG
jgi:hypothetical protein